MIPQSKGKIFPAQERGITNTGWFKSNNTFNYGLYQHKHKSAFESLYVLNDDVLAADRFITLTAEEDSSLVLIPVIGALQYFDSTGTDTMLVSGQLQVFSVKKGISIILKNPYKDEAVHYLQLWIRHASKAFAAGVSAPSAIDLDGDINSMASVFSSDYFTISLGKFTGRTESAYLAKHNSSALFAFVIDGEMEVQYRLLQCRDGLGLWDETRVEFEALSASAILLIAEVPKQQ